MWWDVVGCGGMWWEPCHGLDRAGVQALEGFLKVGFAVGL